MIPTQCRYAYHILLHGDLAIPISFPLNMGHENDNMYQTNCNISFVHINKP